MDWTYSLTTKMFLPKPWFNSQSPPSIHDASLRSGSFEASVRSGSYIAQLCVQSCLWHIKQCRRQDARLTSDLLMELGSDYYILHWFRATVDQLGIELPPGISSCFIRSRCEHQNPLGCLWSFTTFFICWKLESDIDPMHGLRFGLTGQWCPTPSIPYI